MLYTNDWRITNNQSNLYIIFNEMQNVFFFFKYNESIFLYINYTNKMYINFLIIVESAKIKQLFFITKEVPFCYIKYNFIQNAMFLMYLLCYNMLISHSFWVIYVNTLVIYLIQCFNVFLIKQLGKEKTYILNANIKNYFFIEN